MFLLIEQDSSQYKCPQAPILKDLVQADIEVISHHVKLVCCYRNTSSSHVLCLFVSSWFVIAFKPANYALHLSRRQSNQSLILVWWPARAIVGSNCVWGKATLWHHPLCHCTSSVVALPPCCPATPPAPMISLFQSQMDTGVDTPALLFPPPTSATLSYQFVQPLPHSTGVSVASCNGKWFGCNGKARNHLFPLFILEFPFYHSSLL